MRDDLPKQLNLAYWRFIRIPIVKMVRAAAAVFVFLIIAGLIPPSQITAPTLAAEENSDARAEERAELENQLQELERQILEHQKKIQEYRKQGNTLQNEIRALNARINQLNLQIKAINLDLEKLNNDITETQKQINRTENKIDLHKDALSRAIRNLYEADSQSMIEVFLTNNKLSDFFGNLQNITLIQSNLRTALNEVVRLRDELLEQKQELALEKEDMENLKTYRERQKQTVAATQNEKAKLLKVTKGKESEYQKLLKETQETAAEIRSRIFRLLGGGELTFEKAYEYAKLAEGATGVRAAFILAILNQESNFGRNVGKCFYDEIIPQTGKTVMNPRDIPIFLELLERLNIDPHSVVAKVSCPILRDGAHGGAMGPAQFIPSTWKLYEEDIARITKNNPPNPWNNADAFVATALFLKDALNSSSCRSYSKLLPDQEQMLLERCAAAQYYAGGRWHTYRFVYGDPVINKAADFQKDINILISG